MALSIDLTGKTALVTGATSGIGLGIASTLAKAGCTLIACAEHAANSIEVEQFSKALAAYKDKLSYVKADMLMANDIENLAQYIATTHGGQLDILVSNAGKNVFTGAEYSTETDWELNMDLNLRSHWRLAKKCKPYLEKNNGVIILMSSNHAYSSIPGCFPYNIAKTALTGLVKSLAIEWGPQIRTVGIAPGFIDTPGNQQWFSSFENPVREKQRTIDLHPVKKIGTVDEIGAWCAFLASDYAGFASGTTYLIDGGRSALMQDS